MAGLHGPGALVWQCCIISWLFNMSASMIQINNGESTHLDVPDPRDQLFAARTAISTFQAGLASPQTSMVEAH